MMNKHLAMYEYIAKYPGADKLFFNSNVAQSGNVGLQPISSETVVKQYVDGSAVKRYDFSVSVYKDEKILPNTTENVQDLYDVERFMDWIEEQNRNGNFPDFGDDCYVLRIQNLQNMPDSEDSEGHVRKYLFQCSVEFFEAN